MSSASVGRRARENATGIASILVTAAWMGALFTGQEWWLAALLVGYVAVVPIVALLFGDQEDVAEYWDGDATLPGEVDDESDSESADEESTTDALESLRERYARGKLTDEQFERKLDRLLETETVEDAVEYRNRAERDREREPERE